MSGDAHVRFREHLGGRFPGVTRLLVLVKSLRAGQRVKARLTAYLDRKLKLPVNEKKSRSRCSTPPRIKSREELDELALSSASGDDIAWYTHRHAHVVLPHKVKSHTGDSSF